MDTLSSSQRSERMSRIHAKDTGPELAVRSLVHKMGFRYRLHSRELPGCPDLVFPHRKKVLFVHGCFWHRHNNCRNNRTPKTKLSFWLPKLNANKKRDQKNQTRLKSMGWKSCVVWECELKNKEILAKRIEIYLRETL